MTDEEYEQRKRAEWAAYMRDWALKNPDKVKKNSRATWAKHGHKYKAKTKAKYENSPELRAAAVERATKWYQENKERRRAYMADYMRKNRAKLVARAKAWKQANPERAKVLASHSSHIRRTRLSNTSEAEHKQTLKIMAAERQKKSHVCYYCQKRFRGTMHWDHIIPVSKGGRHSPDNICVACEPCNLSKADRKLEAISASGNMLLPI